MNRERYLQEIDAVNAAGKYHPTWESLSTHPVPDWYREKRLGIFLHWGVFSVPAYHDWYARNMYIKGSPEYEYHCQHYGQPKDFGFKDFIPQFKMEAFDPQAWVKLFREAGADYIVPASRITGASCPTGTRRKWVRTGTSWAICWWRRSARA